ncbi:MAG: sulfatase [Acidobacteria bacterium]|nr:sulfatase [Acidobacteriota bacterium]
MTRKGFLQSLAGSAAVPAVGRAGKRNIVLILSDDHSYGHLGCTGHPWLRTPNLDRMAAGGVLFRNAFVTTSLCSPSRASILTGQYAHAHGVIGNDMDLPAGAATFPEFLQRESYRTGLVGKWHIGSDTDEPRPGFERWCSFAGQGVYNDPVLNSDGTRIQAKGYTTDLLTQEALRFLGQPDARPFFLMLSHKAPHSFCEPAERHRDLYRTEPIPVPASMADSDQNYSGKPEWVLRQRDSWHGVDGMYDRQIAFEQHYRDYCRTLMALDESVGGVLDLLASRGMLNDTLVLYMSDNGFQFGEHGLIDKRTMYEPSIRIPMMAHCPDLFVAGRQVDEMVLNLDVAPTFLAAASAEIPRAMHGRSMLELLRGGAQWRSDFLYEYFWNRTFPQTPTMTGLRTERFSYMRYHGIWDLNELYDMQRDSEQMRNLLSEVRITTQPGPLVSNIRDQKLRELVDGFNQRIFDILMRTGADLDAKWLA